MARVVSLEVLQREQIGRIVVMFYCPFFLLRRAILTLGMRSVKRDWQ